jgi:hypothetical protein
VKWISHNFIYNAEAVGIDVTKIAVAFDNSDYYNFGYAIGDIQNLLILPHPHLKDLNSKIDVTCLFNAVKTLVNSVKSVISEFDGHSWSKLKDELKELAVDLANDVESCVTEKEDPSDIAIGVEGFLEGLFHVDFIKKDVECVVEHGENAYEYFAKTLDDLKSF